jgi:hypothetical protein
MFHPTILTGGTCRRRAPLTSEARLIVRRQLAHGRDVLGRVVFVVADHELQLLPVDPWDSLRAPFAHGNMSLWVQPMALFGPATSSIASRVADARSPPPWTGHIVEPAVAVDVTAGRALS